MWGAVRTKKERDKIRARQEERWERVPAPLSPVPLYFSSLSLLRTALHYLNAWNRLREIRLEYVHRGQTYLTASHLQLRYFCYFFLIGRRDGENNGFLASVPLLPPPLRVASRRNSLPLPFRTPSTQAKASVSQRHAFIREFPPRGTNAPHYFLITVNSLSKKVAFGTGPDCPS